MNKLFKLINPSRKKFLLIGLLSILSIVIYTSNSSIKNLDAVLAKPSYDIKTFNSQKLGISFNYISNYGSQMLKTKELGNKVYIYAESAKRKKDPTKGKFVEVFSKDPSESLESAIQNQLLKNYSTENCPIKPANVSRSYNLSNRSYLQITLQNSSNLTSSQKREKLKLCPAAYTYTGSGLMYFMIDNSRPDKFVFLSIGQDNFSAKNPDGPSTETWDQSLKFNN